MLSTVLRKSVVFLIQADALTMQANALALHGIAFHEFAINE